MYFIGIYFIIMFSFNFPIQILSIKSLDFKYHNISSIEEYLKKLNDSSVVKTHLYSIGESVNKNKLWVMSITNAPDDNDEFIPNIKFIATIHGNDNVGREILLHFLQHLIDNYERDKSIQWLLNNTRIHVLPILHPDGLVKGYQSNVCEHEVGKNVDFEGAIININQDFPMHNKHNKQPKVPETTAVIEWMSQVNFILSAGFYGGEMVASYPLDRHVEIDQNGNKLPVESPDEDVFKHLATVYASKHLKMPEGCKDSKNAFVGGVTNGNKWVPIGGSMQDYNYFAHGCMEVSLFISCCHYDPETKIAQIWEENREALISYSLEALRGVSGIVQDSHTKKPIKANLQIVGRDIIFSSTPKGLFWRLLLPNTYQLKVSASGYYDEYIQFSVSYNETFPELKILHIYMTNTSYTTSTTSTSTTTQKNTEMIITSTKNPPSSTFPQNVNNFTEPEIFNNYTQDKICENDYISSSIPPKIMNYFIYIISFLVVLYLR